MTSPIALLVGWLLDFLIGDPVRLPHPIVGFGKVIAWGEHYLNKGNLRMLKGALMAITLIAIVFILTCLLRYQLSIVNCQLSILNCPLSIILDAIIIF